MKVSVTVMEFVLVVVGIVVVAVALYFAATYLFGPGEPPEPAGEQVANALPEGRDLTSDDLRATTLPVTARGYRMADVDALLERLAHQLDRCTPATLAAEPQADPHHEVQQAEPHHGDAHRAEHAAAGDETAADHDHRPAHASPEDDAER